MAGAGWRGSTEDASSDMGKQHGLRRLTGLQRQWKEGGLSVSAGHPNRNVWCHLDRAARVGSEVGKGRCKFRQRSTKR